MLHVSKYLSYVYMCLSHATNLKHRYKYFRKWRTETNVFLPKYVLGGAGSCAPLGTVRCHTILSQVPLPISNSLEL